MLSLMMVLTPDGGVGATGAEEPNSCAEKRILCHTSVKRYFFDHVRIETTFSRMRSNRRSKLM
jgi:hypothetical protein